MDSLKNGWDATKKLTVESFFFQEMVGTMGFMIFGAFLGDQKPFEIGILYALMYTIFKRTFANSRATFNPALVMADIMDSKIEVGAGILTMIVQGFGAAIGYLIVGLLATPVDNNVTEIKDHLEGEFNFYNVLVSEMIGASIMVWLWLDIHSKARSDQWKESFYGFAPGLMYFISMSVLGTQASLNPAKYEAKWFANDIFNRDHPLDHEGGKVLNYFFSSGFWKEGFSQHNMTFYFAPIVAAFLTSLVYAYVNK